MPITQLRIIKKIKFLVASKSHTKKQILDEAEKNALSHHTINDHQEKDDDQRVDHARQELQEENDLADSLSSRKSKALSISVFIGLILLAALLMTWYLFFLYLP